MLVAGVPVAMCFTRASTASLLLTPRLIAKLDKAVDGFTTRATVNLTSLKRVFGHKPLTYAKVVIAFLAS